MFFFSLSLSLFTDWKFIFIERDERANTYNRYSFCVIRYERKTRRKRSRPTTTSRFRGRQSRRAPRRSRRSGGEISQGRRFAFGDEKRRHRGRAGFEFKNRTVEKLGRRGGTIGFARASMRSFSRLFFVCFGDRCERDVLRRRHDDNFLLPIISRMCSKAVRRFSMRDAMTFCSLFPLSLSLFITG